MLITKDNLKIYYREIDMDEFWALWNIWGNYSEEFKILNTRGGRGERKESYWRLKPSPKRRKKDVNQATKEN